MSQVNYKDDTEFDAQVRNDAAENHTILVVEDDPSLLEILGKTLSMDNFNVVLAANGKQALALLEKNSDIKLMLSDVQMKPMNGHELLKQCKKAHPKLPVILMTAYGTIENAVNAIHDGAADYLVKPFEHKELVEMVQRFIDPSHVDDIISNCTVENRDQAINSFIAVDQKSIQLSHVAKRVAETNVTVMITGESGVGKEVVSRFIHDSSSRSKGPFVAINCAAIPENMLESVLFGYEKGAYTGAYRAKAGKFEQAQGGTLLLDEITEMDLGLQVKLLRVLQEREVERLGGSKVIPLDVRIIATTNRDLQQAVIDGQFREDLFYRINVFPLNILPLNERVEDILPIAISMLKDHSKEMGEITLSMSAQRVLKSYDWPGNIRELDNVIQRALILKSGLIVEDTDIQFEGRINNIQTLNHTSRIATNKPVNSDAQENNNAPGLNGDLKAREQDLIISALNAQNSRKDVAKKLGISPRTLRYKLARMRDAGVALPI